MRLTMNLALVKRTILQFHNLCYALETTLQLIQVSFSCKNVSNDITKNFRSCIEQDTQESSS